MKLVECNGVELTVRDLGPVIMTLRMRKNGMPIKINGKFAMPDDAARNLIREQLATGLYDRVTETKDEA